MATVNLQPVNVWQGSGDLVQRMMNTLRRNFVEYAVAQNVGRVSPVAKVLLDNADSQPFQSAFIIQPIVPDTYYDAPQYLTGSVFNINTTNPMVINAQFEPALMIQTCRIGIRELTAMQSPNVVVDQVAIRMSNAVLSVLRELATRLATHDGANTVNEKFQGMQDVVDNGTNCRNFGQIDRATNTWWNSYVYNAQNFGIATEPAYRVVQRVIARYMDDTGGQYGLPDVAFAPFGVWQRLAESFGALEQYVVGNVTDIATVREYETKGIIINGIPIFPEPHLTTSGTPPTGSIYFLNLKHIKFTFAEPFTFYSTPWQDRTITGNLDYVTTLLVGGNLWSDLPRSHFVITNMPAV